MILLVLLAQPSKDGGNVTLDDERLQDTVPKGLQKVELDLDDALFLEFEEKEEPPPPEPEPEPEAVPAPQAEVEAKAPRKKLSKKMMLLGLVALLCLILGAGGAYFFMKTAVELPAEPAQQENATTQEHAQPELSGQENATSEGQNATKPVPTDIFPFAPFQVEFAQDDKIRLLTCRFSVLNATAIMRLEMQTKSVFIRDGIYRYLKNAPFAFLDNPENGDKLKNDLVAVINQSMKSGQVSEILIDEYVVQ